MDRLTPIKVIWDDKSKAHWYCAYVINSEAMTGTEILLGRCRRALGRTDAEERWEAYNERLKQITAERAAANAEHLRIRDATHGD